MYIKDGICYAGELVPDITIIEAKPLDGGVALVTFSTGEKRLFDTTTLDAEIFEPLRDINVFRNLAVSHGTVTWDNEQIDPAPEYVYEHSYSYTSPEVI